MSISSAVADDLELFDEGGEVGGDGGREGEGLVGAGLVEGEFVGMEAHAFGAVGFCSVFVVAENGVAYHRHVDADLVFAAGVQVQLYE